VSGRRPAAPRDPVLERMIAEERIETRLLDGALLGRFARALGPHPALVAAALALALAEALTMTLPAWLIGLAVDRLTGAARAGSAFERGVSAAADGLGALLVAAGPRAALVGGLGLLILLAWSLRWAIAVVTSYIVQWLGQAIVHDIRVDVFRRITGMDAGWFAVHPVGRLVNRTTFDVQALAELFSDAFAQGVRDLFFVVVLGAVMFALDVPLAAILVGTFPPLVLIAWGYRRMARGPLRTNAAVQSRMNAWLAENLAGMRENHLYRAEGRRRDEFAALTDAHQASITEVVRAWALLRPAMLTVTALATALVLLVGQQRVTAGLMSVGMLLTFLQYTTRLWIPVRNLTEKFNTIQAALTAAERIAAVLDARPAIADRADADPELAVREGSLRFEGVRFTYPGQRGPALDGIDFAAARGEMIALVGDTGAGKTTIAKLVSRFHDPDEGRVLIDGRDVRDYTLARLRSGMAIVPQDVVVFAGSLRENATLGLEVPEERVRACLSAVGLDPLVERLGGLDAPLEEGGRTLSAGERQLLSFARALVADPPLLVLDEATANVDSETELALQRALARLTSGRTSLVVAHRLSTIRHADRILVLSGGRILEQGNHETLLARGGEYARLLERGRQP